VALCFTCVLVAVGAFQHKLKAIDGFDTITAPERVLGIGTAISVRFLPQ
jgi:hypothetical protein